ncbi:hypothetical protein pb186bvf_001068 [Paramecium bursaria]
MSLNDKEELLKIEIFNKGYDLEDFSAYMDKQKENGGTDIDIWTYEELKQQIAQYQQIQVSKQHVEKIQQHLEGEDEQNYQKELPCVQVEFTELGSNENTIISIESFEKIETGFFSLSASYVNYKINTQPFGWVVNRRYSDFEWLREIFLKQYPGVFIPPIANKTTTRMYQDVYLIKRLRFLERFLRQCFKSPILRNDKYFQEFLKVKEEKDFKAIMKSTEKIQKTTKIDKVITVDGKINIQLNQQMNDSHKQSVQLLNNIQNIYSKLRKQSKQLQKDFEIASLDLFQMGESFAQLHSFVNQYNKSTQIGQNYQLEALIITLNNMLVLWGRSFQDQIKVIQDDFINFFKYHDIEANQMKEYVKLREQSQQEYLKYDQRLTLKKEKLFTFQEINKWELDKNILDDLRNTDQLKNKKLCMQVMLPKETQQLNDLRDTFAFYNVSIYSEIQRILMQSVKGFSDHFIRLANNQSESLTKMHVHWAEISTNLNSLENNITNEIIQGQQLLQ